MWSVPSLGAAALLGLRCRCEEGRGGRARLIDGRPALTWAQGRRTGTAGPLRTTARATLPPAAARSRPSVRGCGPTRPRRGGCSIAAPVGQLTVNVRTYRSSCTERAFAGRRETSPSCRRAVWHGDSKYGRHSAAHLVPPLSSTYRPGPRCRGDCTHGHGNPSPGASPAGRGWGASWSRGDLAPLPDHAGRVRRRPAGYLLSRYL